MFIKIFRSYIEKQREDYKEILNYLSNLYANFDLKIKEEKILEESRKFFPILEIESENIEKFNKIIKKIYSSNYPLNSTLNNEEFNIFIFKDPSLTFGNIPIFKNFVPAIISPFPDKIRYEIALIKENLKISSGDFVCVKRLKKQYYYKNSTYVKPLIFIEEIEKVDAIKAYKTSRNLQNDFIDKILSMMPEDAEKEDVEKIGAGILSANNGMSFSSLVDNTRKNVIMGIYYALQNSLPKIFRNEKFYLEFENPPIKGRKVKIAITPVPLFSIYEKNEIYPFYFGINSNQTIASLKLYNEEKLNKYGLSKEEILSIFGKANLINEYGIFKGISTFNIQEEPIYDEELRFWIVSQRNLLARSFENYYVIEIFEKNFSKVIEENFNLDIPEDCLNLVAKNSILKESFRRGFEGYVREGTIDSVEYAEKFINKQLLQMSRFVFEFGEKFRKEIERRNKKASDKSKIYNLIKEMVYAAGQLPYDETIRCINKATNYPINEIEKVLKFMNKKTEIKVNKNLNKLSLCIKKYE